MIYYLLLMAVGVAGLSILFNKKIKLVKKDMALQKELHQRQTITDEEQIEEVDQSFEMTKHEEQVAHKKRIPDIVEAIGKAETHYGRGELFEAEKSFIKVLSLQPSHKDAMNKLGIIYLKQENYAKAELILKKLVDQDDKNPVFFSNLGMALYKQGKFNEAVVAYEKAIELDDSRAARFVSLGQVYFELDNFPKALDFFEGAFKREPRNTDLCFQIIEIARLVESIEHQKKYLDKILELDPYNEEAKEKLSNLKE